MANMIIRGAREGNLKNISLELPRNKLIVFTGLSVSGKTTLAIDVIFQECQNLKNINVRFPTGCLVAVTGVSGSGKSTLVFEVLAGAIERKETGGNIVSGIDQFDQVVTIEQSAIMKMKRSNVATYSEVYTEIRKPFGGLKEA